MPYPSIDAAEDSILTLFKTGWDAQAAPVPPVLYDNVAGEHPADGSAWLRVQVKHNPGAGGQQTIGGDPGNKRFCRYGMVVCELFVPTGGGKVLANRYVEVLLSIFEGKAAGVGGAFFYDVRPSAVGQNDNWYQVNVVALFNWDQIR